MSFLSTSSFSISTMALANTTSTSYLGRAQNPTPGLDCFVPSAGYQLCATNGNDDLIGGSRQARIREIQSWVNNPSPQIYGQLLIIFAADEDRMMRAAAKQILMEREDETALRALEKRIRFSEPHVALAAVEILGQFQLPHANRVLTLALTNRNFQVRKQALATLMWRLRKGQLDEESGKLLLIHSLHDTSAEVRFQAVIEIEFFVRDGYLNGANMIEFLIARLRDQNSSVQWAAIKALEKIGMTQAVPALEELHWTCDDTEVRKAIDRALDAIRRQARREET